MSRTDSPGLMYASQWTFVAAAMAESLRCRLAAEGSTFEPIPGGVYNDARAFFGPVMEAVKGGVPADPVASASSYMIAIRVLQSSDNPPPETEGRCNELLTKYSALLDSLDPSSKISRVESSDIRGLAEFFEQLAMDGESEAYQGYFA